MHLFRLFFCWNLLLAASSAPVQISPVAGWPTYGGDPGGQRYSPASQIDRNTVARLRQAWRFRMPVTLGPASRNGQPSLETTPVLRDNRLFFTSAFDEVFAVDAATGKQVWNFDPGLHDVDSNGLIVSRGVALWPTEPKTTDHSAMCATRVFLGTLDARLIALDAVSGHLCGAFGNGGMVDLRRGVEGQSIGGYGVTSPPTVIGNAVIIGSIVGDNQRVDVQSGVVRAFDAETGRQLWSYEPLPWRKQTAPRSGGGNVWSVMSADPQLSLVYLPTSSPALDYYGVGRPGDNREANSIVALDVTTGRRVWTFQTVHHDLWDYDIPSEPLLFTYGQNTPALAVTTKTGQVFVLDRRTGIPLTGVEERTVPGSQVAGEKSWPTQPFSALPSLSEFRPVLEPRKADGFQRSEQDWNVCQEKLTVLDDAGPFTPPSTRGMLQFPGNLGGVNWGGAAFNPSTHILYVNVNRYPAAVFLLPRHGFTAWWRINRSYFLTWTFGLYVCLSVLFVSACIRSSQRRYLRPPGRLATIIAITLLITFSLLQLSPQPRGIPHFGHELSDQAGSPYMLERYPLLDDSGNPCAAPPWGSLVALDLVSGTIRFRSPLGTSVPGAHTGALSLGGPITTAGNLVFDASTGDGEFRAFDSATGAELWSTHLAAPGRATPMTYSLSGRQYVVIAAGGHGGTGDTLGSEIVAYALP